MIMITNGTTKNADRKTRNEKNKIYITLFARSESVAISISKSIKLIYSIQGWTRSRAFRHTPSSMTSGANQPPHLPYNFVTSSEKKIRHFSSARNSKKTSPGYRILCQASIGIRKASRVIKHFARLGIS